MSAVLPKVDTLSICEIRRKKERKKERKTTTTTTTTTWRVSLSIGVRTTMIR